MNNSKNTIAEFLKAPITTQDIFFNIINDIPDDLRKNHEETLNEMLVALKQYPNEFSVEEMRKLRAIAQITSEESAEHFLVVVSVVWQLAKNYFCKQQIKQKQQAGHKSGNSRQRKKIEIIEKISEPLKYALSNISNCKRGDKQEIIQSTLDQYQDLISDVMKENTRWKDKSVFFEYYLNETIDLLENHPQGKNIYPNLIQRRKPRSAESKNRSRNGALKRKKK